MIIQNIVFRDEVTEFSYFEEGDETEFVFVMHSLIVDNQAVAQYLEELMESAQDCLEAAMIVKRNPPKRLHRKRKEAEPLLTEDEEPLEEDEA